MLNQLSFRSTHSMYSRPVLFMRQGHLSANGIFCAHPLSLLSGKIP